MKNILLALLVCTSIVVSAQIAENDPTFVITGTGFNGRVNDMAVQPDGKIIVVGDFTAYDATTRKYIARLNTDGTLDGTFDAGTTLGALATCVAIDAGGNFVVGGAFAGVVKRLTTTGTNDGTFALAGAGINGPVNTIAIDAGGNILVGGSFTTYNVTGRNRILRLTSTGALDTGFDPGTGLNGNPTKIAIQADGKIVVVGASGGFNAYNGTSRDNIVRILSTGAIDATFVHPSNLLARMYDIKFQSDNKIIVTGEYNGNINSIFNGVARLNTDGTMDNTFTPNFFQGGKTILIQADGKIIVGGYQPTLTKGIRRLNTNGTTDATYFTGDGFIKAAGAEVRALAMQSGKLVAAGDFDSFNGVSRISMARVTTCTSVTITAQPLTQTRCATNDASYTVAATGTGGLTYQWQSKAFGASLYVNLSDGAGVTGSSTATLSLSALTTGMEGNAYRCLVTDANCTSTSNAAELHVSTLPAVTSHPSASVKCEGLSTTFSVTVTNPGLYQWQEDAGSGFVDLAPTATYANVGTSTLTINNLTTAMSGYKYRCRVGQCTPSVISNDALLTVNPSPTITVQPVTSIGTCTGTNASFSVTSPSATGYQWQEKVPAGSFVDITNGGIYSGATTATLTLAGVTGTQNLNQYRCNVSTTCTTTSGIGVLSVYATPVFATQPALATKCVGATATFTVGLTSAPTGITYQWQEKIGSGSFTNITNGGIYSGATSTTLTLTGVTAVMDGYTYRCIAGNCGTPATSFNADLTVFEPLTITQPLPVLACPGTNAVFTAPAVGDGTITYKWQEQIGSGSFVDITDGGSYSGATTSTLTIANVTTALNGNRYRCVISNGVCSAQPTSNPLLTVPGAVSITTQPVATRTICGTGNTTFTVNVSSSSTYQWQVNTGSAFEDITNGGVYSGATTNTLTITGPTTALSGFRYRCKVGQCPSNQVLSNEGTLTVSAPPDITTQPVAKTTCAGETTTFTIAATGSSLVYQWRQGGANITDGSMYSGATTSILTITAASSSLNNIEYTCHVTGGPGCPAADSNPAKLTVNQNVILTQPVTNSPICEGGNTTFAVEASGPALTYQWQADAGQGYANVANTGAYSNATTATLTITSATFGLNNINHRVVVGGTCPAVNSNGVKLNVKQKPAKPVITVNLSSPESPVLTAAPGDTFTWFKNGTQTSTSASLNISSEGSYTVLNMLNGCEGSLSDAKVITITGGIALKENGVRLHPNPAANSLLISLHGFKSDSNVDIALLDLLGRTVEKASAPGGTETEVNVTRFLPGRYAVVLKQGTQQEVSHFIKSN